MTRRSRVRGAAPGAPVPESNGGEESTGKRCFSGAQQKRAGCRQNCRLAMPALACDSGSCFFLTTLRKSAPVRHLTRPPRPLPGLEAEIRDPVQRRAIHTVQIPV
jgi:hypothetical protein